MVQQPRQQRKNRRQWRLGFGRLFDQRGAIARVLEPGEFFPQSAVRLAQDDRAQRVQLRAATAREAEVAKVEEVELPRKGDLARRAPLATVAMRPKSGVSQWTMRLVSVSGRARRIRPWVRSTIWKRS